MQTLDAPIYEVNQDSEWYKSLKKRKGDINNFFDSFEEKYGTTDGFSFYHSGYFGVYPYTKAYEIFKNDTLKNPTKEGMYPIKKRSKYFSEIREMLKNIEEVSPFKPHDVFGLNNLKASQWVGDRLFYGVKNKEQVNGNEVTPMNYKDYLKIVMDTLDI